MPPKVRELIRDLEAAGFVRRPGKGSHRVFRHPGGKRVTVSGAPGRDARRYQVHLIREAIEEVTND
jgi:predicted RNA binding protein YcfA (HicA-like mRNA interferase family)